MGRMNTRPSMIDVLESRRMMSATLATAADPDEGGEAPVAQYATLTTTTSADPDEGGEADPDEGGEVTATSPTYSRPLTYKLVYTRAS